MGIMFFKNNKRAIIELLSQIADGLENGNVRLGTKFEYTQRKNLFTDQFITNELHFTFITLNEED